MTNSESPIFYTPGDDPAMEQASAKARETFRFFWREMAWERRRIIPGCEVSAVKAAFADPPEVRARNPDGLEVEHMWISEVDFDGQQIYGTLLNSPDSLQSYQEGDQVEIPMQQLSDWMYVVSGEVCGGFTVDLMRSRMGKAERAQHDQAWGLDFGEVGIVNVVPPEFLGAGAGKKKGLFSSLSKSKPVPQDYAALAAMEHPMSVNMRESLDKALTENPEFLTDPDDRGFTFLHQLALAGSYDGVDVCLQHGADPKQPATNGMTPYALAKSLGWTKVMARLEQARRS